MIINSTGLVKKKGIYYLEWTIGTKELIDRFYLVISGDRFAEARVELGSNKALINIPTAHCSFMIHITYLL